MGKSVYSIVLDDEIINIIDMLSSKEGTSRSNMINRILAQQINLPTTETMINDVFTSIESFMADHSSLAVQLLGSGSLINMRSALQYKYNPSIKYTVEIFEKGNYLGQLKITMRSQNKALIEVLDDFFFVWTSLEEKHTNLKSEEYMAEDGKYMRLFRIGSCENYNLYGQRIAEYIDLIDKCMKEYFKTFTISPAIAQNNVEKLYRHYLTDDIAEL